MHAAGLVHRDLKPANLTVFRGVVEAISTFCSRASFCITKFAQIIDFGESAPDVHLCDYRGSQGIRSPDPLLHITSFEVFQRMKPWLGPLPSIEEMAACRQYGTPTDIYSLGAVLRWLTQGSAEARVRAHSVWIHARSREHMTYLGQMLRAGPCPARRGRFARN